MNDKLIELVNTSLIALQEAIKTAQTELPLLAKEIVEFSMFENIITSIMELIVIVASVCAFRLLRKKHKTSIFLCHDSEGEYYFGYILIIMTVFLCFLAIGRDCIDIVKAYSAPRLFLLESIQKIITK